MTVFSQRLKYKRENLGWSKTQLAKHVGVGLSTYANWEYGIAEPDIDTLKALANLLGTTTDYLTGNTDNPSKEDSNLDKDNTVDLTDRSTVFTYRGKPVSDEDMDIINRLMNGKDD